MIKNIFQKLCLGISAGIIISIGCAVFLACGNRYVGAVMFSVALLSICYLELLLYTGKIGFIVNNHGKEEVSALLLGLLGNLIGVAIAGWALSYAFPSFASTASFLCEGKLEQNLLQTLLRAVFCGILMYIAVYVFKEKKSIVAIVFAIPVFILSGFEHSIADIGYFAIAQIFSFDAFLFIWVVIIGNTVGAIILPLLKKVGAVNNDGK